VQPLQEWRKAAEPMAASNTTQKDNVGLNSKVFTIHVFPANSSYNHKRAVALNPLHGPWPKNDGYETFISTALRRAVPRGYVSPGLRDWETGRQLSQDPLGFEDEGAESLLGSTIRRSFFIEKRRRKLESDVPDVMRSLAAVAKASTSSPLQLTAQGTAATAEGPQPGKDTSSDTASYTSSLSGSMPASSDPHGSANATKSAADSHDDDALSLISTAQRSDTAGESQLAEKHLQGSQVPSSPVLSDTVTNIHSDALRKPLKSNELSWDKAKNTSKGKKDKNERVSPKDFHELFKGP
jgi:hypothetical protein